jgi:hypothetical protein
MAEREFDAGLHGVELDGGASGSGMATGPAVGIDPTQERGSDAWQQALKMGMERNAQRRRN